MAQPYQPLPPSTRTSTNAIVSLIAGIAGWTVLPVLGAIVAIITGHIAKNEIKKSAGMITGNGMATIGLILGYLVVAAGVCGACVAIIITLTGASLSIPFLNGNFSF